jgi:hypothetical protein
MYRKLPGSHDEVLGYEVSGQVSEDEYDEIVTEVQEAVDEFGDARVLTRMPEVPGPDYLRTFAERLRFVREAAGGVERYAVVSDAPQAEWISWLAGKVTPIEVRHFEPADEPDAWQWVSARHAG